MDLSGDVRALEALRGGSWNNNARNLRAANRNRNMPGNRNRNNGFRVALSPPNTLQSHRAGEISALQ